MEKPNSVLFEEEEIEFVNDVWETVLFVATDLRLPKQGDDEGTYDHQALNELVIYVEARFIAGRYDRARVRRVVR
jgi:hypothetical protein